MNNVRICPKCKNLVYFNSYFGAYICENCNWEDASYAQKRNGYFVGEKRTIVFKRSKSKKYGDVRFKESAYEKY